MKKVLLAVGGLFLAACSDVSPTAPADLSGPSYAKSAAPGQLKMRCFSGTTDGTTYGGTCTISGGVDATSAVLNTVSTNPNGAYAGVYFPSTSIGGKFLGQVTQLSFSYSGTGAGGGSPRFSIPIDQGGDGITEDYAFIDTMGCNDGDANVGVLDAINDQTCAVSYGGFSYTNWNWFKGINPLFQIATDALPFVIADFPGGTFTVSNVRLGQVTRIR